MPKQTVYYSVGEIAPQAAAENLRRTKFVGEARFAALVEAQGGCCYLCKNPFTDLFGPTAEHVIPRSRGGRHNANILLACSPCNAAKGDRMPFKTELALLHRINEHIAEVRPGSIFTYEGVKAYVSVHDPLKPRRLALIERMRSL